MPKGIFPHMSIPDIITALGGWGLNVSHDQLVHPSADFVEGVYCACLQQVTGINYDSLREPVVDVISALNVDHEDLYSSAFTTNLILYHLTRFAKAAQVEDFNAKDLFMPERQRTLVLLSAFINFVKFTEQYCDQFVKNLREQSESILVTREQVVQQLSDAQQNLDAMKAKMTEDEPECDRLRQENDVLRSKMFEIKNSQALAVSELEKLKAEKDALVRRREAISEEIATTHESIQRTQSRIVQSPDRIKKRISQMSINIIEDKRVIATHEAKARDLQVKINALLAIEKDLRSCFEQLQTIEKEIRSRELTQKEVGDVKDRLEDRNTEKNQLYLKRERVEKQLANAHEKLERTRRHAEDRKLANQKTIERLQQEYDQMDSERRDNDRQLEELRSEANEIKSKMAEHLRKSEAELNELLGEYWKLRHETDVYMETLANKLNMRVTAG